MLQSKFLEVLKTFSKEDYRKFSQFINSDYSNTSIQLRKLYDCILKNNSELLSEKLTHEKLFEAIYPDKQYREGTVLTLLSRLYKLSEDYIAIEMYKKQPLGRERYLLKGLGERGLNKFFLRNYEDSINELNNTKIQNDNYFYNRCEIEQDHITYTPSESPYIKTEIIQDWHDKLVDFITIKVLEGYVFMLNRKKYGYEHNFNMTLMETVINIVQENSFEHAPAILIYFNLMMLLKDDDEKYYFKLKELISRYPDILESTDTWSVYICMVNFCHHMFEAMGLKEKFSKEMYELYGTIIEKEIYKIETWHPYMHHRLYINIVQNGLYQKEYEWTENFINTYKVELIEEHTASTFHLCYALYYFSIKEFDKSLESLNKVQSDDAFFFLQIKALMLQIYYEMGLFDSAVSFIDSYKHYLKEKTDLPSRYKIQHKNFVIIVNKLLKIKCGNNKYDASELDLSKEEYANTFKENWVLEKIEEIKKN